MTMKGHSREQSASRSNSFPAAPCTVWWMAVPCSYCKAFPHARVPCARHRQGSASPITHHCASSRQEGSKWHCAAGLGMGGLDLHPDALGLRAPACAYSVPRRCQWLHGCSLPCLPCEGCPLDHLAHLWALRQKPEHTLHMMNSS